jgi:hypothetical protein
MSLKYARPAAKSALRILYYLDFLNEPFIGSKIRRGANTKRATPMPNAKRLGVTNGHGQYDEKQPRL